MPGVRVGKVGGSLSVPRAGLLRVRLPPLGKQIIVQDGERHAVQKKYQDVCYWVIMLVIKINLITATVA